MMDGGMLLLAAALSIDALNIGIICGCENIRMAWTSRLLMAAVTMVTTAAAVAVGYGLQGLLPEMVSQIIGAVMLSALGLYMTIGAVRKLLTRQNPSAVLPHAGKEKGLLRETAAIISEPACCDADASHCIEGREAAAIGFALSGDSVACGLSVGVGAGLSVLMIPLLCGVFQMLFLWCGGFLAGRLRRMRHFRHEWLGAGAGILLIIMAVVRCFC